MARVYFWGLLTAFAIGVLKIGIAIFALRSRATKTGAEINLSYDFGAGKFAAEQKPDRSSFAVGAVYLLLFAPLASWLSVISAASAFFSGERKDSPIREPISSKRFKLSLAESTTFSIQSGEWVDEVTVYPTNKFFVRERHTPDYTAIYSSTQEYRIEQERVFTRVLEEKSNRCGRISFSVKEAGQLEFDSRAPQKDCTTSAAAAIDKRDPAVDWTEMQASQLKSIILSKHPELAPPSEFREMQ